MKLKLIRCIAITSIFTLSIALLQGCAAPALSSEPMRFHKDYTENGMIFGSVTFTESKARSNGYFPSIVNLDEDKKVARKNTTEISFSPAQLFKVKHAGELNDGKTYLFAIERAPGKYEIPQIRMFQQGIGGYTSQSFIKNFSIPFDVKKGEITYIGEIVIDETAFKHGQGIININDNFERDKQAIKTKQALINWNNAKKSDIKIILL